MNGDQEPLPLVVQRINPALELVITALRDALPRVMAYHADNGFDPTRDSSAVNHQVRQFIRRQMEAVFPHLAEENANMSPVYVKLGPYHLRVLHAEDGGLPTARTGARKLFYEINDRPSLSMNLYEPGEIELVEDDGLEDVLVENSLVLVWDSEGAELTEVAIYRPSRDYPPGERLDLVTREVVEDDLPIRRTGKGKRSAAGDDDEDDGVR